MCLSENVQTLQWQCSVKIVIHPIVNTFKKVIVPSKKILNDKFYLYQFYLGFLNLVTGKSLWISRKLEHTLMNREFSRPNFYFQLKSTHSKITSKVVSRLKYKDWPLKKETKVYSNGLFFYLHFTRLYGSWYHQRILEK